MSDPHASIPPSSPDGAGAPPVDAATLDAAVEWVRAAGAHSLEWFRSSTLSIEHKGDGSPVTVADRETESMLRDLIVATFPEDTVVGEEHDDHVGSSGRTWVIDPIDGTKAFTHGVGTYSNLLYLEDDHGPAIGIINVPALGETVWAGRGLGCWFNGTRVTPTRDGDATLQDRLLCITGDYALTPETYAALQADGVAIRTWGDAYGYALVATGRVDAMFDPILAWWDLAALTVVLSEAGVTLTRRDGSPDVATPTMEEPYPYSALASINGDHARWVELLGTD